MKRILIAQVARLERERRMAREQQRPQLALPLPSPQSPYGASGALEASAISSLMLAKAYSR